MRRDTSPEADAAQLAAYRRMSGAERFQIAMEMSQLVRDLTHAGIRVQHPDWSASEIRREYLRRLFPPDQMPAFLL